MHSVGHWYYHLGITTGGHMANKTKHATEAKKPSKFDKHISAAARSIRLAMAAQAGAFDMISVTVEGGAVSVHTYTEERNHEGRLGDDGFVHMDGLARTGSKS